MVGPHSTVLKTPSFKQATPLRKLAQCSLLSPVSYLFMQPCQREAMTFNIILGCALPSSPSPFHLLRFFTTDSSAKHHLKLQKLFDDVFSEARLQAQHSTQKAVATGKKVRAFEPYGEGASIAGEPLHDLLKLRSLTSVCANDTFDVLLDHEDALLRLSSHRLPRHTQPGLGPTLHNWATELLNFCSWQSDYRTQSTKQRSKRMMRPPFKNCARFCKTFWSARPPSGGLPSKPSCREGHCKD